MHWAERNTLIYRENSTLKYKHVCTTAVDEIGGGSPLSLPDSILFGISGDFSDTVPPVNPTTRQAALSR